jgi:hypothetical protein
MHPKLDPASPEITPELLAHVTAAARRERAALYDWLYGRLAALVRRAAGRR